MGSCSSCKVLTRRVPVDLRGKTSGVEQQYRPLRWPSAVLTVLSCVGEEAEGGREGREKGQGRGSTQFNKFG